MTPPPRSTRIPAWISGTLLVAGSTLFLAGGGLHPRAATAFGTVGTPEFFRTFADHIQHTPNWIPIHVLILLGPVLWALGLPRASAEGVVRLALENLASRAMLLGTTLWMVVFVLDGFVAPQAANLIASAAPADVSGLLSYFRLNQVAVIRLGLFSWILIGVAMALHGILSFRANSLPRGAPATKGGIVRLPVVGPTLLGITGVAIGIWPIIAAMTGSFDPGPFTSPHWTLTAVCTAFWFAALGVSSITRERGRVVQPLVEPRPQVARNLAPQG